MKYMKKTAVLLLTIIMTLSMAMMSYAAGGRKVYWGISGDTLILSAEETGCEPGGEIIADADFDVNAGRPWLPYAESIKNAMIDGSDGKVKIKDCMDLFYGLTKLVNADLSGLDTSDTTSMWCMFDSCSSLKNVDVSMLNTSKVTNMQGMFYQCHSLETLNLNSFDTGNVTNMFAMFGGCSSLKSLDISSFDMSKVTKATDMFSGCDKLTNIKVGAGWTAEGAPVVSSWVKAGDNTWYCVDMNGNKLTGWQKMWWNDKEDWYYFSQEQGQTFGVCQLGGITPDGYSLAESGAWISK